MDMIDQVVLVDEHDIPLDRMDKLEAHRGKGKLHRAISVFLYRMRNKDIEVLLQQRSHSKPLWPLFWSNTCCSHPRSNESSIACAVRKLEQELGIRVPPQSLTLLFNFSYQVQYTDQWGENELDAVLVGEWSGNVYSNPQEVAAWRWMSLSSLRSEVESKVEKYTPWLKIILQDDRFNRFFQNT